VHLERIQYRLDNSEICEKRFYYTLLQTDAGLRYQPVIECLLRGRSVFALPGSRIHDAQRMTSLVMLLNIAHLVTAIIGILVVQGGS
jgi:hypothetical protein